MTNANRPADLSRLLLPASGHHFLRHIPVSVFLRHLLYHDDVSGSDRFLWNIRCAVCKEHLRALCLFLLVEGLEKEGFKSITAELTRIPQNTIEITDENTASQIMKLLEKIEEHDDVQNVYANFDIADDILQKIEG